MYLTSNRNIWKIKGATCKNYLWSEQIILGINPISNKKNFNFTLEEIQFQFRRNLILNWKKSNLTLKEIFLFQILYLYYDKRRDIWWNIAWVQGKSRGQSPWDFPSIVLPGRAILEELIVRIGLAAGAIFSRIGQ